MWRGISFVDEFGRNSVRRSSAVRETVKGALYIIWCGVNRLGDSGVKVV